MKKNYLETHKYRFLMCLDAPMWYSLEEYLDGVKPLWEKQLHYSRKIDKTFGDAPNAAEEHQDFLEFIGNMFVFQATLQPTSIEEKQMLSMEEDWGITDKSSCIEVLENILLEGHRESIEQLYMFKNHTIEDIKKLHEVDILDEEEGEIDEILSDEEETNRAIDFKKYVDSVVLFCDANQVSDVKALGWDVIRFVNIVKRAVSIGYFSEKEATIWLDKIFPLVNQKFKSWLHFNNSVTTGRLLWQNSLYEKDGQDSWKELFEKDNEVTNKNIKILFTHPMSPWIHYDISADYAMEPESIPSNSKSAKQFKIWMILLGISLSLYGVKFWYKFYQKKQKETTKVESIKEKIQNLNSHNTSIVLADTMVK